VREAIFSALESRDAIRGARVLDLFAGSGALGLEAASRGASVVTLVERSSAAVQICRRNAAAVLKAAPTVKPAIDVAATTVQSFLAASTGEFDLVFVDPPYDLSDDELVHALKTLEPRLPADAIVCVERSTRTGEPDWPAGLLLDRRKDYGETAVWWLSARGRP
jgi:16S rRNA (guanine966-N2)-methyltransferase